MPNATTRLKTLISEPSTVFENRILYNFSCPADLKVKGKNTYKYQDVYIFRTFCSASLSNNSCDDAFKK